MIPRIYPLVQPKLRYMLPQISTVLICINRSRLAYQGDATLPLRRAAALGHASARKNLDLLEATGDKRDSRRKAIAGSLLATGTLALLGALALVMRQRRRAALR